MDTTRAEHLAWCKQRALAYVEARDLTSAFASMVSDLERHPDTEGHHGIQLGTMLLMAGLLATADQMRRFINGLN